LTDCRFENFPIPSINNLKQVIRENPELRGLAITIPYKQLILPFLDSVSTIPEGINACNCVKITGGKLTGYNTDHTGFEKSFAPLLASRHKKALVLGNGGATAAVVFVLKKLGIEHAIVSRKLREGSTLTYPSLTPDIMLSHTVIINTTPLGMYPAVDEAPSIPYELITPDHYLYDLIYNPEKTTFLKKGEERGATIKNGADMLKIQAEENWRIWNT
jgi:shikimate dehydrogenase